MPLKLYILALLLLAAVTIGKISYAGGGSGGMGADSSGMGSGMSDGHGMMGGQGHGMMGYGQNYSNNWREQPRANPTYQQYEKIETERLRSEIRVKRQQLSDLYRAEKPNKEMIDQKITELDKLERKLDENFSDNK